MKSATASCILMGRDCLSELVAVSHYGFGLQFTGHTVTSLADLEQNYMVVNLATVCCQFILVVSSISWISDSVNASTPPTRWGRRELRTGGSMKMRSLVLWDPLAFLWSNRCMPLSGAEKQGSESVFLRQRTELFFVVTPYLFHLIVING